MVFDQQNIWFLHVRQFFLRSQYNIVKQIRNYIITLLTHYHDNRTKYPQTNVNIVLYMNTNVMSNH